MPLIPDADQQRLRADFAALVRPVTLVFFTQTFGCDTCLQAREILDELPALSDKITLREVNLVLDEDTAACYRVDRAPSVALITANDDGTERDSHIRFLGTPSGYEFAALIRAILLVGGGPSMLSDASRERLARIDRDMPVHVFSTPTCPHCPRAVTLAHEVAWANPHVTAYAVESIEYPDLTRQYAVTGVPKTVVDGRVELLGAVPEEAFVDAVMAGFDEGVPETH
jgi:glutaredoxin-like protein